MGVGCVSAGYLGQARDQGVMGGGGGYSGVVAKWGSRNGAAKVRIAPPVVARYTDASSEHWPSP